MYELLKEKIEEYFHAFETKELTKHEDLHGKDIVLSEPLVQLIQGIKGVLDLNKNLFTQYKYLLFTKKDLFID